jgi:hypothetical protein
MYIMEENSAYTMRGSGQMCLLCTATRQEVRRMYSSHKHQQRDLENGRKTNRSAIPFQFLGKMVY